MSPLTAQCQYLYDRAVVRYCEAFAKQKNWERTRRYEMPRLSVRGLL